MRHPLHAICPYFAMFPEDFVLTQLLAYSRPGDLVLDPFSGRGTTILEALLNGRRAIATDINLVAACVSGAKADVPEKVAVIDRIKDLKEIQAASPDIEAAPNYFFEKCYHPETLQEVLFLRRQLNWKGDTVDRFIAALMLGALHGESHRSELCLSNRMPRTISTKPAYSCRWWDEKGYVAPKRDAFEVLHRLAEMRFVLPPPKLRGQAILADARSCSEIFHEHKKEVSLIITSPPYIDTTDYAEDQWLRLWFLGGEAQPRGRINADDRHTVNENYWAFLNEVWAGCASLLAPSATIVIRIGGHKMSPDELFAGISEGLQRSLVGRNVNMLHKNSSAIKGRQTNAFRPGTTNERMEHDFTFRVQ